MSLPYFAILGRQPELGLVELESLLGPDGIKPFGQHALLASLPDIGRLGGAVKLGRVIYDGKLADITKLALDANKLPWPKSGKVNIGLSFYGVRVTSRSVAAAGLDLKKRWKPHGSLRIVAPSQGTSLSAAQLIHNGLPGQGFELVVVADKQRMIVGITAAVQDIEAYAKRDYGRPARSAKVGMLPPKLAQILINTTTGPVVDPFCGTGVVLQEALLMGRTASGSDLEAEMVEATRTNLEWLLDAHGPLPEWSVIQADARGWQAKPGQAIVSEGYLGPNLSRLPRPDELAGLHTDLAAFYRQVFSHWAAQLEPGSELAMCLPSWRTAKGWSDLPVVDELPDMGYTFKQFAHADSSRLRYARPDQIVGRRILLLKRLSDGPH